MASYDHKNYMSRFQHNLECIIRA